MAKLPEGWVSLPVRMSAELAERLKAEAKGRRLAVDSLIAYYAKEGLERDDLKPDEIDKLRRRHSDVLDLHHNVDGQCWACGETFPCATYLVLTEDPDEYELAKGRR